MEINFSGEKLCVGYNDGNGMRKCPACAIGHKQCSACAARDISRVYTRLDYSGFERFFETFKNQEFSVYLASFGHIVKCGVTRSARLMDRVREQGADYFSEIGKINDAETAYSIESAVQQHYAVRNGLTSAQKLKLIRAESTPSRISEYVDKIKESGLLEGFEGAMKVQKLDYPIPHMFEEAETISGKITGNKGQVLFFEKDNLSYAINMSKKAGMPFTLL